MSAPGTCPQCGAVLPEGESCQSLFESFLVLEYSHPLYGSVHLLTVACYMIQHGRYSDEGLRWIEQRLRDYLELGLSKEQIRARAAEGTDQSARRWKVTRQQGERLLPPIRWSMTIADVATTYDGADSYATLVKQWARHTLAEMQPYFFGI